MARPESRAPWLIVVCCCCCSVVVVVVVGVIVPTSQSDGMLVRSAMVDGATVDVVGRQGWQRVEGRPLSLIVVCVLIVLWMVLCVPIVVVPKSRSDGGPDGITMVDGTCVDVVGGGVSLCCCCWHCCCHRCSACVSAVRYMFGMMQGDDDNRLTQRLVVFHDVTRHNA